MLKIGLTGGIGSGKTTVARLFQKYGIPVLDSDRIAHELVQPGQPALAALATEFGPHILTPHGHLDRARLRNLAFHDAKARARLEAILHPAVFATLEREVKRLNTPYCLLAIPLLVETGSQNRVDRVLVIDCPEKLQVERVRRRDGLEDGMIRSILASQASRRERLACADDIIDNGGDMEILKRQAEELHRFYLSLSAKRNDP